MILSLNLTTAEVAALQAKQETPTEPLDAVLRRLYLTPLVAQFNKTREFDRITRILSLYNAAPRPLQQEVLTLLRGVDPTL